MQKKNRVESFKKEAKNNKIKLPSYILSELILEYDVDGEYYRFKDSDFLYDIDLTDLKYYNLYAEDIKFLIKYGIVIDPQKIYERNLSNCDFNKADFNGNSFDGCCINKSSFKGSKGAKINPQKILYKDCSYVDFTDAEIIDSFEGCNIVGMVTSELVEENSKKVKTLYKNIK